MGLWDLLEFLAVDKFLCHDIFVELYTLKHIYTYTSYAW